MQRTSVACCPSPESSIHPVFKLKGPWNNLAMKSRKGSEKPPSILLTSSLLAGRTVSYMVSDDNSAPNSAKTDLKVVDFAVAEGLQCISRSDFICIQNHLPWARGPIRACPEPFQEELSEPIGCRNGMRENSRQGHERQLVLSNVCCSLPAVQLIHLNLQGRKVGPRAIFTLQSPSRARLMLCP